MFTLGVILYELLFDAHPFPDDYHTAVENGDYVVPPNPYHRDVVERIISCLRPVPAQRPKAGWVHAALHAHHASGLEATDPADRYVTGYVQLSSDNFGFRRTYYRNMHLGRTNLRGSGVADLPARFLRLRFEHSGASIELTSDGVSVSVSGVPLVKGVAVPLQSGDVLSVGPQRFSVVVEVE